MAEHQPRLSQIDLARAAKIGQATVSRWIYQEGIRPKTDELSRAADVLNVTRSEILHRAGHGTIRPINPPPPEPEHPLVTKLRRALDHSSTLTDEERTNLELGAGALLAAYDPALRRTRRPQPGRRAG
jgi:transcriptional regulator with XRE-family HTH domain